jgi:hypothetical protein
VHEIGGQTSPLEMMRATNRTCFLSVRLLNIVILAQQIMTELNEAVPGKYKMMVVINWYLA